MNKTVENLLVGALLVAGIVFLALSIFSESTDTNFLAAALGCIVLSNALNVVRVRRGMKKGKAC